MKLITITFKKLIHTCKRNGIQSNFFSPNKKIKKGCNFYSINSLVIQLKTIL